MSAAIPTASPAAAERVNAHPRPWQRPPVAVLAALVVVPALVALILFRSPSAPPSSLPPAPAPAPAPVLHVPPPPSPAALRERVDRPETGIFGIWAEHATVTSGTFTVSNHQTQLTPQQQTGCRIIGFLRDRTAGELLGLRRGDVLVAYDGHPTPTMADVVAVHRSHRAGDVVTVTILRDGTLAMLTGPLGQAPLLGALVP